MMARALSVVGRPDTKRVMLHGSMPGTLVLAYQPNGEAVLVGSRVAMPDTGMMFELWLTKGTTHLAAGTFVPSDGVVVLPLSMSMRDFDTISVTQEPGRTGSPTGKTVWSSAV